MYGYDCARACVCVYYVLSLLKLFMFHRTGKRLNWHIPNLRAPQSPRA